MGSAQDFFEVSLQCGTTIENLIFVPQERRSKSLQITKLKHPSEDDTWTETYKLGLTRLKSELDPFLPRGQASTNDVDSGRQLSSSRQLRSHVDTNTL